MPMIDISAEELKNLDNSGFTILYLYVNTTPLSRTLRSRLESILNDDESLNILKFEISEDKELIKKYKVNLAPVLILLQDNDIIAKKAGITSKRDTIMSKEEIAEWINSFRKGE